VCSRRKGKGLTVEFLERIFMKSAKSYKRSVFGKIVQQRLLARAGRRQNRSTAVILIADYWIENPPIRFPDTGRGRNPSLRDSRA